MPSILWTGWSQMFASAKLAKMQVRVKPEQAMAARNQNRRIENKPARAMRWVTQTHLLQRFQPPGADPHAGWCGRGAVNDDCPLCRSLMKPTCICKHHCCICAQLRVFMFTDELSASTIEL